VPFLPDSLKSLGLLNYHPLAEIMSQDVKFLFEIHTVRDILAVLSNDHNGFPVVSDKYILRGFILRKTICALLKNKVFSEKVVVDGRTQYKPRAAIFHDKIERSYPNYPKLEEIIPEITEEEKNLYLDVRSYMDTAPHSINESCSIQRCYRYFRTMGLRHLTVLDRDYRVKGIITRHDLTIYRLEHHWFSEGDNLQRFMNVDSFDPIEDNDAYSAPSPIRKSDNDYQPRQNEPLNISTNKQSSGGIASSIGQTFGFDFRKKKDDDDDLSSVPPPPTPSSSQTSTYKQSKEPKSNKAR
jgi:CBS domain-containing protein